MGASSLPASPCSRYVREAAVRLFLSGYVAKLVYDTSEDGHLYFTIPSESRLGTFYGLDYEPVARRVTCSCPAGMNGRPCKHVLFFELCHGAEVSQ